MIVAVFQVFDGLQAIASRALRGIKDTIAPLWLAGAGYWVLGITKRFAAVALLSGVIGATTLAAYEILIAWVGTSSNVENHPSPICC